MGNIDNIKAKFKTKKDVKPWNALSNIQYLSIPDTSFTRDKTGEGSIEYFSAEHPQGITYSNGYHVSHPSPGNDVILYNPNENDEQDIRLDALHIMPKDEVYDILNTVYRDAAINSDVSYNARKKYEEDVKKYGAENIDSYEQYFNNEADGLLRNMFIEGSPEYIESKRYYPDKEQLRAWNKHLLPYIDQIQTYLETGKRPYNVLPEITITAERNKSEGDHLFTKGGKTDDDKDVSTNDNSTDEVPSGGLLINNYRAKNAKTYKERAAASEKAMFYAWIGKDLLPWKLNNELYRHSLEQAGPLQNSYLLSGTDKDRYMLEHGYLLGEKGDYGLVKKAVGKHNYPIYQTQPDEIDRKYLVPIGNIDDSWYGRENAMLKHPGHFPSTIYVDGRNPEKFYQKAWDLNDYSNILDWFGYPAVQTTGFSKINYPDLSYSQDPDYIDWLGEKPARDFLSDYLKEHNLTREVLNDGTVLYTHPEVTIIAERNKSNGGSIHIDPSKKGTFTAAATKHGMGVQEFASKVLSNKEDYSPEMVKKANFARNASGWKRQNGGALFDVPEDLFGSVQPNQQINMPIQEEQSYIDDSIVSMYVKSAFAEKQIPQEEKDAQCEQDIQQAEEQGLTLQEYNQKQYEDIKNERESMELTVKLHDMKQRLAANAQPITTPYGQWEYPGQVTRVPSNDITMRNVPYPVLGVSDTGDTQMMYPERDYHYNGTSVTEYPMIY